MVRLVARRLKKSLIVAVLAMTALAGCLQPEDLADDGAENPAGGNLGGGNPGETVTSVVEGEYNFTGPYSRVLEPGDLKILSAQRDVIQSRIDNADILMGLHLPDTDEPVPALVFASPYFGFLGGENDVTDRVGAFGNLVENFVPHGYAVVGVAVRGTGGSGGCNDLMGPEETRDLDQAISWIGTQEWSNGNVAMTGVSYDGSTPWGVASTGNPHLKTIIPISGVPDMFSLMYRNGSSESRGPVLLNALYYGGNIAAGTAGTEQLSQRIVCPEALQGIVWSAHSGLTGNQDRNGWWLERNRKPAVEAKYNGSVFSVQGLQDWNVDPSQVIPWVDDLERKGLRTKQLLGQWGHAWPDSIGEDGERADRYRADHNQILLHWMDQELKGLERDTGAPVQVMDSLGRWRNEAHFPPHDTNWTTLHLGDGVLQDEPGQRSSIRLVPYDEHGEDGVPELSVLNDSPLPAQTGRAWVDFSFGPVEKETLVVGLPRVHVAVTPDGPGGYIGAYLFERDGDRLNRLGWTSMDLSYHAGATSPSRSCPGKRSRRRCRSSPWTASCARATNSCCGSGSVPIPTGCPPCPRPR